MQAHRLMRHVRKLCKFSPRLAGTASELAAAEYVAEELERTGAEVVVQQFPILRWQCKRIELKAQRGRHWVDVPAFPVAHTPATAGVAEGKIIVIEHLTANNPALRDCRGHVALVLGLWGEDPKNLEALINARPLAAILIDDRFPSNELVQVGLPMGWVKKLRVPAVTVPYFAGWELARKPVRVRLRVDCVTEEGSSVNVIGRLRGSRRGAKGILIGAHHDSIAIGQSADDNATGVACVIEIAKALARADRKRDVWAVTFGCEENLSVGAEAFVRKQEFGASRLAAMINFDSCGSLLGRTHALVTGPPQMRHWVTKQLRQLGKQIQVQPDVSPYSDHFFFAAAGVPAIWFHRTNCAAGRWYHHQSEDTVEVIGQEALQTVALAGLALADRLSRAEKLPYRCLVPGEQLERARLLERAMACWPPT